MTTGLPLLPPDRIVDAPRGVSSDEPLVGVDLRQPRAGAPAGVAALRGDRILVGIGPVAPGLEAVADDLDLTLVPEQSTPEPRHGRSTVAVADPEAALAELEKAMGVAPRAATLLAGLLRWSVDLPVLAALDAESLAYSTLLAGPEFATWLDHRGTPPLPPEVPDPVLLTRNGGTLRLTLNRPERRNAYGRQLRDALVDALDIALLDPTVEQVVLTGTGPAFCSGGDLDEFGTTPDLVTAHLVRTRGGAARPLHALRDRIQVRLHGACIGAGIELPAFAGRVVAAPDTVIRLPEIAMGLIPGAGGTVSLPRRIGRHRTCYLALSGTALTAPTALAWGLVDEITD